MLEATQCSLLGGWIVKCGVAFYGVLFCTLGFPSGLGVKNLLAVQEMQVWFLGWDDLLEEVWQPTPVFLSMGDPMDRGAWWATVHRVAKDWTQLKRLSRTQDATS